MKTSSGKKVVDVAITDDGYQFYVLDDGTYQDNLNDDLVDLSGVVSDDFNVVVID